MRLRILIICGDSRDGLGRAARRKKRRGATRHLALVLLAELHELGLEPVALRGALLGVAAELLDPRVVGCGGARPGVRPVAEVPHARGVEGLDEAALDLKQQNTI